MYSGQDGKFLGAMTGKMDSFYNTFKNHCAAQELPAMQKASAFSVRLTGDSYRLFINNLDGK